MLAVLQLVMKMRSSLPWRINGCLWTWRCVSSPQSNSHVERGSFMATVPTRLQA